MCAMQKQQQIHVGILREDLNMHTYRCSYSGGSLKQGVWEMQPLL